MGTKNHLLRREVLKSTAWGALGLSFPALTYSGSYSQLSGSNQETIPAHYPYIDPKVITEVVGKSHFDLDAVRKLVDTRPELANAIKDWRYGDFESALGAASHVGRRDIAFYLMSKGAAPTLFTYAMLGYFDIVQSMVRSSPGIQKFTGPHGISLLDHAYAGEEMKDSMTIQEIDNVKRTIEYLESLGDADGTTFMEVSAEEQQLYLGDYKYGEGANEGFTVKLNQRQMISLAPIGQNGGALYKIKEHTFIYNGAPSVTVYFDIQNAIVKSLTVTEPGFSLSAMKLT